MTRRRAWLCLLVWALLCGAGGAGGALAGEGERTGEPERRVRLIGDEQSVARTGPGDSYAIAGVFGRGADFEVIAKSGDWINVRLTPTDSGWLHASLCREYDDLSGLEMRANPRLYSRVGSFLVSAHGGGYAFDRKSNSLALGGRLGYYVFDFVEVEGGFTWTHVKRPLEITESLFDLSLESEDFHLVYYQFNTRVELAPGRRMAPFVTAGVGSTIFQGSTESSFNYGAGTLFFLNKRNALRWECRNYRFESGAARARRMNNNLEFSLGASWLL